ncbi:MAG: IS630 family transposase [Rhodospirillales bacterium]|nr:IS630 family transposase [Acetobacter sp.]
MAAPIALRSDFTADELRRQARRSHDAGQARRLLALATIYDGGLRSDAARVGGVTLQIVRDWVVRFNAEGLPGLIDRKAAGRTPKLNDAQRQALAAMVEQGPDPAVHGVVRWRLADLAQWLWEEYRVSLNEDTVGRELRKLGYRKLSARPRHHAQDPNSLETFKKNFPAALARIGQSIGDGKRIEVWFQDEARVGQKNGITRRWAERGSRPSASQDQRTASAYLFGAICPAEGKGAAVVLPRCTIAAMNLHLAEVATAVAADAHAVLLLDQAGWHMSHRVAVPPNITLMPLPPRAPELNPVENVWQFMRQNWLSNRVFTSYRDIVDHCCHAWNRLVDQPWRIMSIGLRDWVHAS